MVPELNSRPLHRSRQWDSLAFSQRRRSSVAAVPPAGPPPTQPIPSLPMNPSAFTNGIHGDYQLSMPDQDQSMSRHRSSTSTSQSSYGRPAASANLVAVAAFPQTQQSTVPLPVTHTSQPSSSTFLYPDPASNSATPTSTSSHTRTLSRTQDIVPDRLLLSPHQPNSRTESRPSSRRALTRALELAREAVQLDATNDDPHAAVIAYGRSVALLSEVMERVRRGEDSTEGRRRNGRRRSVVAQEEEVRRLKSIVRPIPTTAISGYSNSPSARHLR